MRRKILPAFEPLSESTESESDESKKNSPVDEKKRAEQAMRKSEHSEKEGEVKSGPSSAKQEEQEERREELRTPGPVDIVAAGEEFEEGEISSSSEIEVGGGGGDQAGEGHHDHDGDVADDVFFAENAASRLARAAAAARSRRSLRDVERRHSHRTFIGSAGGLEEDCQHDQKLNHFHLKI